MPRRYRPSRWLSGYERENDQAMLQEKFVDAPKLGEEDH